MAIRHWPEMERPREKLQQQGVAALSDAELLAICLRHGVQGDSAVTLARDLLGRFGGLRALFRAPPAELLGCAGIGPARVSELAAIAELGRRMLAEQVSRGTVISDPVAVRHYLLGTLRDLEHEIFGCLFLDSRHRVIRFERLFRGTIDGASVHPREVVRAALAANAAAVVLVHNHPSGVAEPSRADVRITGRLKSALDLIDVRVLDHLIVGDAEVVSLAERGLL
ncbi:MAG: JAB domain-containing protein [Gammaproteobacteria bacterium]|nr:MAG: JAB domain-containing protein [Gammaproteobacteria bacterium]